MKNRTILIIMILAVQIGCAVSNKKANDIYLLREGNIDYADGDYLDSEKTYKKILDDFPDSPYRANAMIGLADSLFRQGKYMEASYSYRDFYDLYPVHKDTEKAHFYKGISSFNERNTAGRDQTNTVKALEQFEKITTDPDFSKSLFYDESVKKIGECKKLLAYNTFSIGKYYFKTASYGSAISRMKALLKDYPNEPYEDEVLYIIAESYFLEDNYTKATIYFENIVEKYTLSRFVLKARERLSGIKAAGDRLGRNLKLEI